MKNLLIYLVLFVSACSQVNSQPQNQPAMPIVSEEVKSYQERQETFSPEKILNWLQEGNTRFAKGESNHGGFLVDARPRREVSAKGQRPLAVVLSCIDSRTSPELVFDAAVGDLFTVRVGANVVNEDILGSLEIAVESGAKVLVVMGHTDCGGVKAACNNLELGHMTQLLNRIKPVITATNKYLDENPLRSNQIGERTTKNRSYVAEVSHRNAQQSLQQILEKSPSLKEKFKTKEIIIISALYDVESGKVLFDAPVF